MNARVFSVFNRATFLFISLTVCKLDVFYVQNETLLLPALPPLEKHCFLLQGVISFHFVRILII
jgi:hypothetical protein